MVDDEDYQALSGVRWSVSRVGATTYAHRYAGNRKIYMHREILGAAPGQLVDHVNLNGLDNRRLNLRLCTKGQNTANTKRAPGRSGYRGVVSRDGHYHAMVWVNGRRIRVGIFETAEEAARARDRAAQQYLGQFARLNFAQGEL